MPGLLDTQKTIRFGFPLDARSLGRVGGYRCHSKYWGLVYASVATDRVASGVYPDLARDAGLPGKAYNV